jgi:predicted DNA-binding transcriptional regulator YafY
VQPFDRVQQLHQILTTHHKPVPVRKLREQMECSDKTVMRTIDTLRDYCLAPLVYSSEEKGWHYDSKQGERFQLPGLWLTGNELLSLSALTSILEDLGDGVLHDELNSIKQSVDDLLVARNIAPKVIASRVRVLPMARRQQSSYQFTAIADALIQRKQLEVHYVNYNGQRTLRTISPQSLVYYRDNWYLDAWCHKRDAIRTFSVPRIQHINLLMGKAKSVNQKALGEHFHQSYGIFAGGSQSTAKLRFFGATARDVAAQSWHPDQQGEWQGDEYLLSLPYADDRELIQDVLRYTPHVYVEAPVKLRKRVQLKLQQGLERQLGLGLGFL